MRKTTVISILITFFLAMTFGACGSETSGTRPMSAQNSNALSSKAEHKADTVASAKETAREHEPSDGHREGHNETSEEHTSATVASVAQVAAPDSVPVPVPVSVSVPVPVLVPVLTSGPEGAARSEPNDPPEFVDMAYVMSLLESRLRTATHARVTCELSVPKCVVAYQNLLAFDWSRSELSSSAVLVIDTQSRKVSRKRFLLSYVASADEIRRATHINVRERRVASGGVIDVRQLTRQIHLDRRSAENNACRGASSFYDRLYSQEDVNFTIVFGYEDRPELRRREDGSVPVHPFAQIQDIENLTQSLVENYGFKIVGRHETQVDLERRFIYRGEVKKAHIHIVRSLVLCPGEEGRESDEIEDRLFRSEQPCQAQVDATFRAKETFSNAFSNSEVVIYSGHSRFGHGPDFGPNGSEFGKFAIARGALNSISFRTQATFLLLESCASNDHFSDALNRLAHRLYRNSGHRFAFAGNIGSEEQFANYVDADVRFIVALLNAQCSSEIAALMDLSHTVNSPSHIVIEGLD